MRLAILGGSFNPVHIGHLALAEDVVVSLGYDRLLLVPSFKSPFKADPEGASAEDRLDMLAASVEGDRRVTVEDCELRRGDISYTVDTVAELEERYRPEGKIGVVLGDDLAAGFTSWMHAGKLADRTELIVGRRVSDGSIPFPFPHRTLANERIELSSTQVRRRIAEGGAWRYLVSEGARAIIEERGLYGLPPGRPSGKRAAAPAGARLADIEREVRSSMETSRYLHSRGVALTAVELCGRFLLDQDAAYLAGIAHDLCKEYPLDAMRKLALADGRGVSDAERDKPSLLHARAAAMALRDRYGEADEAVLEAIRSHTFGGSGLGPLAKVLYVADKIEPTRRGIDPALRELARTADLETIFEKTFEAIQSHLRASGKIPSDEGKRS